MDGGEENSIGLRIEHVLRSDMGNYTLELKNEVGAAESPNAISLDVHCKYNHQNESACVKCCAW